MRGSEGDRARASERARGEGVGGGCPPSHVRRFFENLCMQTALSSTLNDIIIGVVYVRVHMYQSNYIPPF